jgi:DNA recombination protein RmuC
MTSMMQRSAPPLSNVPGCVGGPWDGLRMEMTQVGMLSLAVLVAMVAGALVGAAVVRGRADGRLSALQSQVAGARAERDLLAAQVSAGEETARRDRAVASELAPLRQSLARVEQQVGALERDRVEQFGRLGETLREVAARTATLGQETATLAGALNSSGVRGTWGEAQLRRVLEHAGMLARCDFDEQVSAVTEHDARVRPDVLVRLPGDKCLVIDAKAPLQAFLRAQADNLSPAERTAHLRRHATSLRGHVETLAGKAYWSAFTTSPELVVCFVPSDAVLAAALQAAPDLYDHAQSRKVVLASPATLLAVLRATAFAWQQDSLTEHAREVLRLGGDLHSRLGTLGRHVAEMGASLRRSVQTYNKMVGTLESRVMVTSRQMHELGIVPEPHAPLAPVVDTPRPLTEADLICEELAAVTPARPELEDVTGLLPRPQHDVRRDA